MTSPEDRTHRDPGPGETHLDAGETFRDVPADATRHEPRAASYGNAAFPPPEAADEEIRLRFGAGPAAPKVWQPTPRPRRRRSRVMPFVSIAVSAAIIGGVAWYLLGTRGDLAVSAVRVQAPAGVLRCDGKTSSRKIRVVATVTLNGRPGLLTYRWTQSDSRPQEPVQVRIARGEKSRDLPLDWTVSGAGRAERTATFEVLSPGTLRSHATFRYSCS
ncbi:hypothetical protein [Actinocorallia longicatena]|uniref:Ig-like domain-containing protein n=1 Tax=Actinocorallia longicatena TaxID=111803 RepID=A0ABP6QP61_9ACTN